MKKCTICDIDKNLSDFNKKNNSEDGHQNICRECSNERSRKYYSDNKEKHKKVIIARKKGVITENRKKLFNYYKNNPCVDCGEDNPLVLEFDHKDGVDKMGNISRMVGQGCSWITIKGEIEKCDVRCANCHRIRTAKQQGWYKDIL